MTVRASLSLRALLNDLEARQERGVVSHFFRLQFWLPRDVNARHKKKRLSGVTTLIQPWYN